MEVCRCENCYLRILSERDASDAEADRSEAELTRLRAELAEARALVEKREAQIEWLAARDTELVYLGGDHFIFEYGPGTVDRIEYNGTRAGLLAAVDEATKGEG